MDEFDIRVMPRFNQEDRDRQLKEMAIKMANGEAGDRATIDIGGENKVVDFAKKTQAGDKDSRTFQTTTGHWVKIEPVPDMILQSVMSRFPYPRPPEVFIEEKGRKEENPNDPDYVRRCQDIDGERANAFIDITLVMGVTLMDGISTDNSWVKRLQLIGIQFDADDAVERDFAYKKYVVFRRSQDFETLSDMMGVRKEDVDTAVERFQRQEIRDSD